MQKLFSQFTQILEPALKEIIYQKLNYYSQINPYSCDSFAKIANFSAKGKLLRGSLVMFSAQMFGRDLDEKVIKTASAMEIFHSVLLIHDDIMDQDIFRRGEKSLYQQYIDEAVKCGRENSDHIGKSLAICLGDFGIFLAYEILSEIEIKILPQIINKFSQELVLVGLAQMQDVMPFKNETLNPEKVLEVYRFKTGQYSISLPLVVGAMLAGKSEAILAQLEELGNSLGILFQITDDQLGLSGLTKNTGKSIGSDIREDKQTLYRTLLFQKANPKECNHLKKLFGNQNINQDDIDYILELIRKYKIDLYLDDLCRQYMDQSLKVIPQLEIDQTHRETLMNFVQYIRHRKK